MGSFVYVLVALTVTTYLGKYIQDLAEASLPSSGVHFLDTSTDPILDHVRYLLWTRENSNDTDYYELKWTDQESLSASHFDGAKKTYFIYHGYGSEGEDYWILDLKTQLLALEAVNVISVDWGPLAATPNYVQAVENVYLVANYTAQYIDWMVSNGYLDTSHIHIIGYSLGAHTAGMTAAYVTTGSIDRVTGLDPAGPLFQNVSSSERLDKSNADFVDVIHTNSGNLSENNYGLFPAVGHVDFYPNGGRHQPGCNAQTDLVVDCSHARAPAYLIESVLASQLTRFVSSPCSSWQSFEAEECIECIPGCLDMGLHVQRNLNGTFYLATNSESPYALGTH